MAALTKNGTPSDRDDAWCSLLPEWHGPGWSGYRDINWRHGGNRPGYRCHPSVCNQILLVPRAGLKQQSFLKGTKKWRLDTAL
jgi:hypothetical protein